MYVLYIRRAEIGCFLVLHLNHEFLHIGFLVQAVPFLLCIYLSRFMQLTVAPDFALFI